MDKIIIHNVEYRTVNGRYALYCNKPLLSISEIKDINFITSIRLNFATKEEAEVYLLNFPKSYRSKVARVDSYIDNDVTKSCHYFSISFKFNTFHTNKSTGAVNETAITRRIKVVEKLKQLGY